VTQAEPAVVHINVTKMVKTGAMMNGNPFAGGDDDDSPFPNIPGFRFPQQQPRQRDFAQKGAARASSSGRTAWSSRTTT
jgi:hypothetical protein